jgi:hypothetical protein
MYVVGVLNSSLVSDQLPGGERTSRKQGLMVSKDPDGSPLAFSLNPEVGRDDLGRDTSLAHPNTCQVRKARHQPNSLLSLF